MGNATSSGVGIAGIVLLIIGIILFIIGIILLATSTASPKPWYTWGLLIAGIIVAILGLILIGVGAYQGSAPAQPLALA